MNFLIESENFIPKHDFGFAVVGGSKYRADLTYILSEEYYRHPSVYGKRNPTSIDQIAIGSVDFVHNHILNCYGNKYVPKPLLIPSELNTDYFLGREYKILKKEELPTSDFYFIKSANLIKGETNILNKYITVEELTEKEYICSTLIDIASEHRVFVHNGKIVDIRTYSTDYATLPNIRKIEEMIKAYKDQPLAYTLDVAVTDSNHTVIVELHNMYSCSLYGMQDTEKATIMMSQWFCEHIRKNFQKN